MIPIQAISQYLVDPNISWIDADELGFVQSDNLGARLLTFATDAHLLQVAEENEAIVAALLEAGQPIPPSSRLQIVSVHASKAAFWRLHNSLPIEHMAPTRVAPAAKVHSSAALSDEGVVIGPGTMVEAHVTIYPGVTIGQNCVIRSGARIGGDALDVKKDRDGSIFTSRHMGRVAIGDRVEIGHNAVVDKALFRQQTTTIGDDTKIGCLTNVSHGVALGRRNILASGVCISGSTIVGDDNWFGPNSTVSHLRKIGSGCFVSLGSSVLHDLQDGWKVVGTKVFRERKLF